MQINLPTAEYEAQAATDGASHQPCMSPKTLYARLEDAALNDGEARQLAYDFVQSRLDAVRSGDDDLPADPAALDRWMLDAARSATDAYKAYLAGRKEGAPRRFFRTRAHALHFLRAVAPTKLVDGAWLYGLLRHKDDTRLTGLVQTYLEELGNGDPSKNHVTLYRQLLVSLDLPIGNQLPENLYEQGALQLALGLDTQELLPEVIGFNLGYEQLPLHLMITAYELDELGIDPYYFTLHITVDNAANGHALKAVEAVIANASRFPDAAGYWRRVRNGYRLNDLGVGTMTVIEGFDLRREVVRILQSKAAVGAGAHSDYCRLEGRTVNQWLENPEGLDAFLTVLRDKGWIVDGDPEASRFWKLLIGERAQMFGVFDNYELQVVYDWIRGERAFDGRAYDRSNASAGGKVPSFRARQAIAARAAADSPTTSPMPSVPRASVGADWITEMRPGRHWMPSGLQTTRGFVQAQRGG